MLYGSGTLIYHVTPLRIHSMHCSNPIAGTDATMLALTGAGYVDGRTFGFASCERRAGATEGMNVLMQRRLTRPGGGFEYAYNVTNVEYTEFERYGISDTQAENSTNSLMPANTNVLYVNLKARYLTTFILVQVNWLLTMYF